MLQLLKISFNLEDLRPILSSEKHCNTFLHRGRTVDKTSLTLEACHLNKTTKYGGEFTITKYDISSAFGVNLHFVSPSQVNGPYNPSQSSGL